MATSPSGPKERCLQDIFPSDRRVKSALGAFQVGLINVDFCLSTEFLQFFLLLLIISRRVPLAICRVPTVFFEGT